ncbi:MAG: hypothetical protein ACI9TI_002291 [Natronomonas sp.]|jgi:hypothetical protein|uniref:DUF5789 family protein n=1 Tax=Natronomonas sp. TaxID=2184060 RepID=UPI0039897F4B
MRLSDARDRFVSEFTFPVERETVLKTIGDVEIDGLTDDPETVEDVLHRTNSEEFHSADELYDTIIGSIGSEYVGRRFYDDRGSNAGIDVDEVSF